MAAAGLVAVALFTWLIAPARSSAARSQRDAAPAAIQVDAVRVTRSNVPVYLDGLGTIQAFYTVKLTARVDGELTKVAFTEGQQVKRGQLLAQIDPRPFQAALDQARATLAKDEAQLADAHKDLARKAQTEADEAAIENASTQLSYTRITAPIDGRTGMRLVDPGNIVHATDTGGIVVLTQLQPITAIFTLPEDTLGTVADAMSHGQVSVEAVSRDEDGKPLDRGTVQLIDNQIDQTTGTIRLKAVFPNPKLALWPGQFVNLRLLVRTDTNALTIPAAALQRGPDGTFVYLVRPDSTVAMQPVTVANNSETVAIVTKGLEAGQQVVTSNAFRLQPGTRVRILTPNRAPGTAASPAQPAATGHQAS